METSGGNFAAPHEFWCKRKDSCKMSNRLFNESSPYLLQHAENPVDWYPWGTEAFERAADMDLPILLSVGYSACHWCHVMERESFENDEIAALMNANFVNIKVDREERPDVDDIYMTAVQAMTGQGGWPLTVFLTPDRMPFFGGTYFPPEPRGGHPGFPQVLQSISDAYKNRRPELSSTGEHVLEHLTALTSLDANEDDREAIPEESEPLVSMLESQFDWELGGFGNPIKFPQPFVLELLLQIYRDNSDTKALQMVEHSLLAMYSGGIYDHVGGGFHRYSTDRAWIVPHFEKMLYDNALLSRVYIHAYQATGKGIYKSIALDIYEYVLREMTSDNGLFYSAEDADTNGEEGSYYTWDEDELLEVIGFEDCERLASDFNVTKRGNFEGRNILHPSGTLKNRLVEGDALALDLTIGSSRREKLLKIRSLRTRPLTDDKAVLSWNALMVQSLADGFLATGCNELKYAAIQNIKTCLSIANEFGELFRSYRENKCSGSAYLEDYGSVILACIKVHEITLDQKWLLEALKIAELMLKTFWDDESPIPYDVKADDPFLPMRPRNIFDNAVPSGLSQALEGLSLLRTLTGNCKYKHMVISILDKTSNTAFSSPLSFANLLRTARNSVDPSVEVMISVPNYESSEGFLEALGSVYLPNRVLLGVIQEKNVTDDSEVLNSPISEGRMEEFRDKSTAYLCRDYSCQLPVHSPAEFLSQLKGI